MSGLDGLRRMQLLYFILTLIGLGLFAAVVLSVLTVVLIIAVAGWLARFLAPLGKRRGLPKQVEQTP